MKGFTKAYELIVFHFLLGVACYMGREWELSFRRFSGMRPWITVAYSAPVTAAAFFLGIYVYGVSLRFQSFALVAPLN